MEEAARIMIYMVEQTFDRPEWEAEWDEWYFGNLDVLLAVPGFHSAQRFRIPEATPSRYMALYTVEGPQTFESQVYIQAGGNGANSVRFRPAYRVWIRNLFDDVGTAPDVPAGHRLVTMDSPEPQRATPAPMQWGRAVGFHQTTPYRGFIVVPAAQADRWRGLPGVTVYDPHRDRFVPKR